MLTYLTPSLYFPPDPTHSPSHPPVSACPPPVSSWFLHHCPGLSIHQTVCMFTFICPKVSFRRVYPSFWLSCLLGLIRLTIWSDHVSVRLPRLSSFPWSSAHISMFPCKSHRSSLTESTYAVRPYLPSPIDPTVCLAGLLASVSTELHDVKINKLNIINSNKSTI